MSGMHGIFLTLITVHFLKIKAENSKGLVSRKTLKCNNLFVDVCGILQ